MSGSRRRPALREVPLSRNSCFCFAFVAVHGLGIVAIQLKYFDFASKVSCVPELAVINSGPLATVKVPPAVKVARAARPIAPKTRPLDIDSAKCRQDYSDTVLEN